MRRSVGGSLVVLLLAAAGAATANDTPPIRVVQHEEGIYSLYFHDVPAVDAVRLVASMMNLRFDVAGEAGAANRLTLTLERVAPREALDRLLRESRFNWAAQAEDFGAAGSGKLVVSLAGAPVETPFGYEAEPVAEEAYPDPSYEEVPQDEMPADFGVEEEGMVAEEVGETGDQPPATTFKELLERAGNNRGRGPGGQPAAGGFSQGGFVGNPGSLGPAGQAAPAGGSASNPFAEALRRAQMQNAARGGNTGQGFASPQPAAPAPGQGGAVQPTGANPFLGNTAAPSPSGGATPPAANPFGFQSPNPFVYRSPTGANVAPPVNPFLPQQQQQQQKQEN